MNDPGQIERGRETIPRCQKLRRRGEADGVKYYGTGVILAEPVLSFQQRIGISSFVVGHCRPCQQRDKTRRKHVNDEPLSAHGDSSCVRGLRSNRGGGRSTLQVSVSWYACFPYTEDNSR